MRQSSVSRASTATDGAPVEETSAQANVAFDTAMLFQNNAQTGGQKDDSGHKQALVEYPGSSQTFASIMEESVLASKGRDNGQAARRAFSGYVTRAINIYESNAKIIHGTGPEPLGSTISLTL